jgi:hypothetical protein
MVLHGYLGIMWGVAHLESPELAPTSGAVLWGTPCSWGVTLQYQNIITSQAQEYFGVASSHISKGEKEREEKKEGILPPPPPHTPITSMKLVCFVWILLCTLRRDCKKERAKKRDLYLKVKIEFTRLTRSHKPKDCP